jgi:hypothetical protein
MLTGSVLDAAYASLPRHEEDEVSDLDDPDSDIDEDDEVNDSGPIDGPRVLGEVRLAKTPRKY